MDGSNQQMPSLPCFLVNNISINSIEQCKFVMDNECLEEDSMIDYVYLIYCDIGCEFRYLSIMLVILLIVLFFLALSAVADEFLCPSLLAVAKNLRMSDSLAGVTLLAFGNGCPDIFSSLAAASGDRSELIVGELLGAGIFCTSIVSGLIFIHSDFKLACRPVLRDTTFYLLAVYLMWSYCWAEEITFYGSLTFIIIYVIYLIVALGGQAIHSRLQGVYAIAEKQNHDETNNSPVTGSWFKWREESMRRRKFSQPRRSEVSPINAHITSNNVSTINLNSSSAVTHYKQGEASSTKVCTYYCSTSTPFCNGNAQAANLATKEWPNPSNHYQQHQVICTSKAINDNLQDDLTSFNEWDEFLNHVNPLDLENWQETRFGIKLIRILRAPFLLAAIFTVPVVDSDKRISNWCRPLNALHCITVPLTVAITTRFGADEHISLLGVPLPILLLIPGTLMALFVIKTTCGHKAPKYHPVFAYFGFMMSILWIYLLASEIIGLLKTVGIMFSMTDTAIGLGILAWGNSLGDIVANISLAEAGYPRMAIGASIGAPLLNLLLGFGLSFTISLKPGESASVKYSPTITLLCSTLIIILTSLMLSTLAPPEKSKRPFGYLLICCYGVYFALAVCLEYGIINV